MRAFQVQVQHLASRVGPRIEKMVQGMIGPARYRNRFHISADASVNKMRLTLHFADVIAQKTVFWLNLTLTHHSSSRMSKLVQSYTGFIYSSFK